jgi:gluconate 2-dehydrogenase alpha chain
MQLRSCMFCGFCERYGCEHYAKSSPQTVLLPVLLKDPKFSCAPSARCCASTWTRTKKKATSVTYADAQGREFEQPASLFIVGMFALNNVRLLLLSGIGQPYDPATGKGVVGRNYAYQTTSGVQVFFDEKVNINPFMRSGACGTVIADFVSDNFDHGPLGFLGGAYVGEVMTTAGRSNSIPRRPARRPGARPGRRRWRSTTTTHQRQRARQLVAIASRTTWTWTRPTRTRGACRCCA